MTILLLLALAAGVALYVAAARRLRAAGRGWPGWRIAACATGAALLGVAGSAGVASWAHHDFRGHMVQHLTIGMFAPLALVLSAPVTLLLGALPPAGARRLAGWLRSGAFRRISHPASALALDAGVLYVLYLTPLYAAALQSPALHATMHAHFLLAGCLFAWAIAGRDPAPHRSPFRTRLLVLFAAVAAHATLAKAMYAYGYPRGTHHSLEEIQAAAQLMYYGGDAAELLLAVALFSGSRGAWSTASRPAGRERPPAAAAPPPAIWRVGDL